MVWKYICTNLQHSFGVWEKGERVSVLLGLLVAAAIAALPLIGISATTSIDLNTQLGLGFALWFAVLVLVVTPYRLWREQSDEIERLKIRNRNQAVLDQISALKHPLAALRIEMRQDEGGVYPMAHWDKKYKEMQGQIAEKIREFSTEAEVGDFLIKGNLDRVVNSPIPHQLYIDMCTRDLDWVSDFVRAYSRGKAS
jgi:hypothetical protein